MKKHRMLVLVGAAMVLSNVFLFTRYRESSVFPFLDKHDGVLAEKSIDSANADLKTVEQLAKSGASSDRVSDAFSSYLSHHEDADQRLIQQDCGTGPSTWPITQYNRISQRIATLNSHVVSVLSVVASKPQYQTVTLTTASGTKVTLSEQLAVTRFQSVSSLVSCPAYGSGRTLRGLDLSVGVLVYCVDTAGLSVGFLFALKRFLEKKKNKK